MKLLSRVVLACLLFGCFLVGMGALEMFGPALFPQPVRDETPGALLDEVFTKAGFLYGPQSWRPGYDPIGISPGKEVAEGDAWYRMFIDLNTTPVSGNPNVKQLGSVRIRYNFTELSGRAAFHVYGLTTGTTATRTNRQIGTKNCGFMVTGTAPEGGVMPAATPLTFPSSHQYRITLSNSLFSDTDNLTAGTCSFRFIKPGAGQGALHLTPNLSQPMGGITETTDQGGIFYVTATGANAGNNLILLAAVDRPQPDGFALRVRSEFVRTT